MALFSKAIQLYNHRQEKYFDAVLNIDIKCIKNNLRNNKNFFSHYEQINKFIQSIRTHQLKKDINNKSIK